MQQESRGTLGPHLGHTHMTAHCHAESRNGAVASVPAAGEGHVVINT